MFRSSYLGKGVSLTCGMLLFAGGVSDARGEDTCTKLPPLCPAYADAGDDLIEELSPPIANYDSARERVTLSVFIHLVESASGESYSDAVIPQLMAGLNNIYSGTGLSFVSVGSMPHPHEVAEALSFCPPQNGPQDSAHTRLDVYIQKDRSGGFGARDPYVLRCISGDNFGAAPNPEILAHEIGHSLGLYHPFDLIAATQQSPGGSCTASFDINSPTPQSDGYLCGDLIADNGFLHSDIAGPLVDPATCEWLPSSRQNWVLAPLPLVLTAQGIENIQASDSRNIMNNYSPAQSNTHCGDNVTPDQAKRMKLNIEVNRQDYGVVEFDPQDGRGYVFWGAIYPEEFVLHPVDHEAMFVGESIEWTEEMRYFDGQSIIDEVQVVVNEDGGGNVHDSFGWVPNATPYSGWGPSFPDVGKTVTATVTFKNDYSPDYTHQLIVESFTVEDILLRQEQVLLPLAGYDAMGPLSISWTTENSWRGVPGSSELVLDVVDILLSTDGGLNYNPTPIALGEVNDGEYQWAPSLGTATANARIKIVWHNVVNSGTVEAESAIFSFGGRPFQMVNRSVETGLAASLGAVPAIAAAEPYGVAAADYTEPVPDAIVSYSNAPGQIYAAEDLDASGAPLLRNRSLQAFQLHSDFIGAGHRGAAIGNFDSNPDAWSLWGSDQGSDLFLARETGARVYRSLGLSGEQFPQYQDVIDEYFGGSGLFDGSWCGQWTDTDGDGLVDLVVGRAALPQGGAASDPPDPETLEPALLRLFLQRDSSDPQAPGFDEVGLISGLTGARATISLVAVDLDGDGDRDLVVGDLRTAARGGSSVLYRNDSGTFTALTQFSAGGAPASVSGVAVADLDADGTLDIVVSRQGSAGGLPPQAYRGLGSMTFAAPLDLPVSFSQSGVSVFDHDANQTLDLLFLPEGSQDSPAFLANLSSPGQFSFLDRTAAVGLDDAGKVGGVAAADFDGDGRTDLLLGRRIDGNKFFYRSEKSAPISDEPVHIAIQIEGGDGGNPDGGDGAVLTLLRNGQPMTSQNYALPSGGSQSDQPVLFAVPDDGATYSVQTAWGEGHIQTDAMQPGQLNLVQDATSPSVVPASMTASYTPGPGGTMSMTFEWNCSKQAVHADDRSHVSSGPGCLPWDLVIAPGQPDVTAECSQNPNGTEHHKLTLANMDCIPQCVYTWWCESSTRFVTSETSANTKTIKTKVCIQ